MRLGVQPSSKCASMTKKLVECFSLSVSWGPLSLEEEMAVAHNLIRQTVTKLETLPNSDTFREHIHNLLFKSSSGEARYIPHFPYFSPLNSLILHAKHLQLQDSRASVPESSVTISEGDSESIECPEDSEESVSDKLRSQSILIKADRIERTKIEWKHICHAYKQCVAKVSEGGLLSPWRLDAVRAVAVNPIYPARRYYQFIPDTWEVVDRIDAEDPELTSTEVLWHLPRENEIGAKYINISGIKLVRSPKPPFKNAHQIHLYDKEKFNHRGLDVLRNCALASNSLLNTLYNMQSGTRTTDSDLEDLWIQRESARPKIFPDRDRSQSRWPHLKAELRGDNWMYGNPFEGLDTEAHIFSQKSGAPSVFVDFGDPPIVDEGMEKEVVKYTTLTSLEYDTETNLWSAKTDIGTVRRWGRLPTYEAVAMHFRNEVLEYVFFPIRKCLIKIPSSLGKLPAVREDLANAICNLRDFAPEHMSERSKWIKLTPKFT